MTSMSHPLLWFGLCAAACSGVAPTLRPSAEFSFDDMQPGPSIWRVDPIVGGEPVTEVTMRPEDDAPSPPNVLSLRSSGHVLADVFHLFWTDQVVFGNGSVSVRLRESRSASSASVR